MSDIECPYCGHEQEICHDDGFGYEEGVKHEDTCYECEKEFTFTTCMSFDYYPEKADCLNEGEHDLSPSRTIPREYTRMQCKTCDFERPCNDEEKKHLGYWDDLTAS